jgi:uncharacterized protein YndB with AHSA1/START domain
MTMNNPEFVYTTYIKSTPEKVWAAITNPEFTKQYWGGMANYSDWRSGSNWEHRSDEGEVYVGGEVEESIPPGRLVLTWADPGAPEDVSRVTFEIDQVADLVRLNVVHGDFTPGTLMAAKVKGGWPRVLSSLKSMLETGTGIDIFADKPRCERPAAAVK